MGEERKEGTRRNEKMEKYKWKDERLKESKKNKPHDIKDNQNN